MGYKNLPTYTQGQIDRILQPHQRYSRAYIDDIVIFLKLLEEHLRHLQNVFQELTAMQMILLPKKSFLAYSSIRFLGQRVDAVSMATAEAKLAAIMQLAFLCSHMDLKVYLRLTGYLRQYITYYAQVARPLQNCKTFWNWSVNVGGNARQKVVARTYISTPTNQELNAFHHLQQFFLQPLILSHYNLSCQLYINLHASKAFGFGAMVYHSKETITQDNGTPPKRCSLRQSCSSANY